MTTGIYTLTFPGLDDWKYVGQSINLETRLVNHKSCLRLKRTNYKLLEAYSITGQYPVLEILETCDISSLDTREVYWISTLDSINNGLNITDKVVNKGYGDKNFNSKHTNESILEAFLYIIINLEKSNKDIAAYTGLPIHIIVAIMSGTQHTWIKSVYPEEYTTLISRTCVRTNSAEKMGIKYPLILSPTGEIFKITNLQEFSREHNINNSSLHQLLKGLRKSANKWTLAS